MRLRGYNNWKVCGVYKRQVYKRYMYDDTTNLLCCWSNSSCNNSITISRIGIEKNFLRINISPSVAPFLYDRSSFRSSLFIYLFISIVPSSQILTNFKLFRNAKRSIFYLLTFVKHKKFNKRSAIFPSSSCCCALKKIIKFTVRIRDLVERRRFVDEVFHLSIGGEDESGGEE